MAVKWPEVPCSLGWEGSRWERQGEQGQAGHWSEQRWWGLSLGRGSRRCGGTDESRGGFRASAFPVACGAVAPEGLG